MSNPNVTKKKAAKLLRRYDKLRTELRVLEHDLAIACADYGRTIGVWGLSKDHLRIQLMREQEKAA